MSLKNCATLDGSAFSGSSINTDALGPGTHTIVITSPGCWSRFSFPHSTAAVSVVLKLVVAAGGLAHVPVELFDSCRNCNGAAMVVEASRSGDGKGGSGKPQENRRGRESES